MTIGYCKHGEFDLELGCPQCIAEYWTASQTGVVTPTPKHIVKVNYYSETAGELSGREYTYYSVDPLKVGDIVTVPVRDTTGKAQVSAIDVPEAEIVAFKDRVKTIPTGSIITESYIMPEEMRGVKISPNATRLVDDIADKLMESEQPTETVLALRPGEDVEVHSYFLESRKLLDYAEHRTIKTLEDAKTATDDLSIISRLKKAMEAKRKEMLSPHEVQVKTIRDTYNYLMTPILEAERITKVKQTAFLQEQERIQREQEEINRKRYEAAQTEMKLKGELTESVNLVEVTEAPERIHTNLGITGMVDHWIFEVTDFAQVPDEYKVIDSAMLNTVAKKYHDQKPVKGIRFYNQPYIATRTK